MDANHKEQFVFAQPRAIEERRRLAHVLVDRLGYRLPLAVDPMDDRAGQAFAAWPERIYILSVGGRVLYKSEPGPFGFKPEQAEPQLQRLFDVPKQGL